MGNYWNRYQSLLEECPTHNLMEVEVYLKFYDGMDARSKDLVNSSSGESFNKLRLSKDKIVLGRLLSARREYEDTDVIPSQKNVKNAHTRDKENLLESRIEKLEEILQSVIQAGQQPSTPTQTTLLTDQVHHHQNSGEVWSMSANWNLEDQVEAHQTSNPIQNPTLPSSNYPLGQWYIHLTNLTPTIRSMNYTTQQTDLITLTSTYPIQVTLIRPASLEQGITIRHG